MKGQKREQILRVLLSSKKALSKNDISKKANCSRQWVIQFLRGLEKQKLVEGTAILDKKKLIDYWLQIKKNPKKIRNYMVKQPLDILKKTKLEYALTTYQAENIVQHYLFPSRVDLYVKEEDIEEWHKLMMKNGLYGKGNVRLIIDESNAMQGKRKIKGLSVASLPQLVLDLISEGGVCTEAGRMLLKRL